MDSRFDIKTVDHSNIMTVHVIIDGRTGVQYMVVSASDGYGQGANTNIAVTPLLNADGTLCTGRR